ARLKGSRSYVRKPRIVHARLKGSRSWVVTEQRSCVRRPRVPDSWSASLSGERASSVAFLRNLVLLQLLVQIAARRADHFGRLRDVPAVLAQLADEEHPLRVLLELDR